jgi:hypothetical protein
MRSSQELAALREQAVRLRREGKSRREIKKILGFIGNSTLNQLLRDEPLPPERAGPDYAESKARAAEGVRRYWAAEHPAREAVRAAISAAAAAQFGELTDREIIVAGAIAYWCEGAKSKTYRIDEQVRFVNSDPASDQVLPHVPRQVRRVPGASPLLRLDPRECRRRGGHQVLDERDGRNAASVHPARDQAPHAADNKAGRQFGLLRLPASIRGQEQRVVPRN